jgi:subtilisin family serine protease
MLHLFLALIATVYGLVEIDGLNDPSCIQGQYIVRYHENSTLDAVQKHWALLKDIGVEFIATYNIEDIYKGFAAKLSDEVVKVLQLHPMVAEMSLDCLMYTQEILDSQQSCGGRDTTAASWGLARVSHRGGIGGGMNNHYTHGLNGGSTTYVYVVDTGINVNHRDFGGRATWGANYAGGANADGNGHGTHCAGTVGGATYGVAKGARLVAVKVLSDSGSGSISGIISGINWCVSNYNNQQPAGTYGVISMSLGGTSGGTMQTAIRAAKTAGMVPVVAAGNSNANACSFYPAAYPECITVGATDAQDYRSTFSNYGTCTKIFAPGTGITSCWYDGSTAVLSGTSMACPHVSGQAAVLLSAGVAPASIESRLRADGNLNQIKSPGTGSPNILLYNGCT